MDRNPNDRIDVDGHPENTHRELNMQPGRLDDIEQPEAYATRTGQRDVTGELPENAGMGRRTLEGEQLHDREDMTGREGMAGQGGGSPMERGDRQAQTGGGRDRVAPGEEIGGGMHARPADGLNDADGRVNRGEDIGHGIRAKPADGYAREDGVIAPGEDIGNGVRARRADEQDPGNPLV
jgi:hypothetical protein